VARAGLIFLPFFLVGKWRDAFLQRSSCKTTATVRTGFEKPAIHSEVIMMFAPILNYYLMLAFPFGENGKTSHYIFT